MGQEPAPNRPVKRGKTVHTNKWNIGAAAATAALAAAIATAAGTGQIHFGNAADSKPTTHTTAPKPKAKAHHQDGTKITINNPAPSNPAPANQAPAVPAGNPQLTSGPAVVLQFYADLSNQDYADAWQLGGDNLNGGTGYDQWVAGYSTTASISVDDYGTYNDDTVWTHISALQTDGPVKTYDGTYTVANGVVVSANITQTS